MKWLQKFKLKYKYGFKDEEIKKFKKLNESNIYGIEKRFISLARYNGLRYYLDNPRWRSIIHNKWISANFFSSEFISMPKTYGLLHPVYGKTAKGEPLKNADDLERMINKLELRTLVLKHIGGGMGSSVFIVDEITQNNKTLLFKTIDGSQLKTNDINNLLEIVSGGLKGYIVQERLQIHPAIKKITDGGISSIRVYTFRDKTGKSSARQAMIGFGLPGKTTDHSINGGIMAPVDCDSGLVSQGVQILKSEKFISHHPVSDIKFEGFKVPGWPAVRELAERASEHSPGLNWVGWDLAVTTEGPVLLEGNVGDKTVFLSQLLFGGFLENGIYETWMNNLDLPEDEKTAYNAIKNWKSKFVKSTLKKILGLNNGSAN